VLLAFIYNVDVIPLTSLRVIRGDTLFRVPNDPTNRGYSLYVSNNYLNSAPGVGLKELQLTSLRGMILPRYFSFIIAFCIYKYQMCNYLHCSCQTYDADGTYTLKVCKFAVWCM